MVLLAVVFVAAGLGVAGAGLYASRSQLATHAQAALSALDNAPRPDAGLAYRFLEPLGEASARVVSRLSPAKRPELTRHRNVLAGKES